MVAPPTYMGGMVEVMQTEDLVNMIGLPFKKLMRDYSRLVVSAPLVRSYDEGFTENSVLPHPDGKTNRYGLPLPHVEFEPNAQESKWVEDAMLHAKEIMLKAGADPDRLLNGGVDVVHKVGTCRMGFGPDQ